MLSSTPEAALLDRWLCFAGPKGPDNAAIHSIGEWVSLTPHLIAKSVPVRWAATCLLDSIQAFVKRGDQNHATAVESNAKALQCIRNGLGSSKSRPCKSDVMLAIKLLFVAEIFIDSDAGNYYRHMKGLNDILCDAFRQQSAYDEACQQIFYGNILGECIAAMRSGHDSKFYGSSWFDMSPPKTLVPGCPNFESAMKLVMQLQIEMTHFIRIVRETGERPNDNTVRQEAIELATKLYQLNLESLINELIATSMLEIISSSMTEVKLLFATSYTFSSTRIFNLVLNYWICRVLICGGIEILYSFLHFDEQRLNLATVQQHDVRTAEEIVMCFEYAYTYESQLCIMAMRFIMPLQTAFGAWHRLEKRALGYEYKEEDAQRAMEMKKWCISMCNKMGALFGQGRAMCAFEEMKTETLAGGPLFFGGILRPED
ncbi:uncharacterized protein LY89DRAFT_754000 [Mollisia scopiformis]|uniref:Uncharacterized protein n=1 Tax=Mollisia scopiformis TaxID=149040 RepID=A0A194WZH1_MOLSC|nr:uncharacterized protein LY89DRAFT_754000 [Mollisia scopiformis]KUJ13346.1 hypothetical protein LY89DRAFT_754000 [Mollisia scopiformis]